MKVLILTTVALLPLSSCVFFRRPGKSLTKIPPIPRNAWYVDLSRNNITKVPKNSFQTQTRCMQLSLQRNLIAAIEPGAFCGLQRLKKLSLGENRLTVLQSGVFDGLRDLNQLDLNENFISTLSEELFEDFAGPLAQLFKGFAEPLALGMSDSKPDRKETDNPWDCQSLCWLQEEVKAGRVTFIETRYGTHKPLCADGTKWEGLVCGKFFAILLAERESDLNTVQLGKHC